MTLPSPRLLALGAGILALAAALGAGGWWWYRVEQDKALDAWARIETRLVTARGPQGTPEQRAAALTEIEQFLAAHRSSSVAPLAAFELATLRFAAGQHAAARVAYELALARGASPTVRTLSRSGLAGTWEAERDFARAAALYQALLADLKPGEFQYEQTLLDLARTQLLVGRRDQAIATYERLLRDLPSSARADDVRARLASLAGAK